MSATTVSKAIGIDLGTTNSSVAIMDPRDAEIVIHRHRATRAESTPSCVWKDPHSGEIVVGRDARKRIGNAPSPIRSIKRLMGRDRTVRLTDEDVSPERVSALILAEMKRQIEEDVQSFDTSSRHWIVDRAVITVPAYFDQPSIDATRRAAEMAGLEVLDLLHEPTAAAAYHCWRTNTHDGLFVVYDLGGGTFDVAVLRSKAGRFEVLGVSGNRRLGGDDLDVLIAERIHERLTAAGYPLDLDPKRPEGVLARALLARMGENVKIELTASSEYTLNSAMGLKDAHGNTIDNFETWFEREEIEALVRPTLEWTIPKCFDALDQARERADVTLADVDAIVLAGGSTQMPAVRELVRRNLCALDGAGPPREDELADPRAAGPRARCEQPVFERVGVIVALGAAVRAAQIGGLEVYDSARRVRVSFRGVGVTNAEQTHVGGRVEALEAGLDMAAGAVRLRVPEFGHEDEHEIGADGGFGFREVPVQPSADNALTFEIFDTAGALVATVTRPIRHDKVHRGGGGMGTAVLSKALRVAVLHEGQRRREVLVEALTPLPHTSKHIFGHPGATELVLVALYQASTMIQCIEVPVPSSLAQGTPVQLQVTIDKTAYITVSGDIDGHTFSAQLRSAPEPPTPTAQDLAGLEVRFNEALNYVREGTKNTLRLGWHKGKEAYDAAVRRGDLEAAVNAFEELENLVDEIDPVILHPPKAEFDKKVFDVRQLNDAVARTDKGTYDPQNMALNIDEQRKMGEQAYREFDQIHYRDAFVSLEGYFQYLRGKYHDRPGPPVDPARAARQNLEFVEGELRRFDQIARACERTPFDDTLQALRQQVAELRERPQSPEHVITETGIINNDLARLWEELIAWIESSGGGGGKHILKIGGN